LEQFLREYEEYQRSLYLKDQSYADIIEQLKKQITITISQQFSDANLQSNRVC
jgi:hypothetical protein